MTLHKLHSLHTLHALHTCHKYHTYHAYHTYHTLRYHASTCQKITPQYKKIPAIYKNCHRGTSFCHVDGYIYVFLACRRAHLPFYTLLFSLSNLHVDASYPPYITIHYHTLPYITIHYHTLHYIHTHISQPYQAIWLNHLCGRPSMVYSNWILNNIKPAQSPKWVCLTIEYPKVPWFMIILPIAPISEVSKNILVKPKHHIAGYIDI